MGDEVRRPAGGLGPSSVCLQEKKVLVSAVSVAVEAILAQFSSSRTVVQKALSGDSAINPSLGRLVLQCLCPALHNLLADGLKPHQSDLIAGRRPNSAWALVQASTAPSPKTQVLFNLQVRVAELPQLRQSKYRFNAFLLGLLNTKCLDFWLSHLLSCNDVLESFYRPDSFMRLSLSACRPQFEELLLVLQPLSLLTFNLDLLFQHHHLEADGHTPPSHGDAAPPQASQPEAPRSRYLESLSVVDFRQPQASAQENRPEPAHPQSEGPVPAPRVVAQTSPQLLWVQEAEIAALPPPNAEEDSLAQQAGQVIQQGWGAVLRWGGKLSQNLAELAARKEEMKTDLHHLQAGSDFAPVCSGAQVPWALGRLFGAPKNPNSPQGHSLPTRRPSQWLAPSVTALTRMVSSSGSSAPALRSIPELRLDAEPQPDTEADGLLAKEEEEAKEENGRALRSVRTLCDHAGTGSQLTFCKGEELLVLGGVDGDWIRCRQGDREGLVPIGYTSLIM